MDSVSANTLESCQVKRSTSEPGRYPLAQVRPLHWCDSPSPRGNMRDSVFATGLMRIMQDQIAWRPTH